MARMANGTDHEVDGTVQDRKHQLVLRSGKLRADLIEESVPLSHSLSATESAVRVLGRLRQHPEWIAAAAIGIFLLRPSRLAAWSRGTTFGVRTWRQLQPLLASLR